jgi:hypothetical protein
MTAASECGCRHCGMPKSEHHAFEALWRPDGCTCDPTDWRDNDPLPTCPAFRHGDEGLCANCQHPADCHAAAGAAEVRP